MKKIQILNHVELKHADVDKGEITVHAMNETNLNKIPRICGCYFLRAKGVEVKCNGISRA